LAPVRNDPNKILGIAADPQAIFAGLLDVLLTFACTGTAVALHPVVKRQTRQSRSALPAPGGCRLPSS
jgi:hypothetical protein